MFGSFHIGTVFGIALRVHWLFLAMLVFFALIPQVGIETVLFFGVIGSAVIVLHELGHCLVAKSFGIRVLDITLWPLGGMARMTEIPENTRIEVLIAIAGPAVNFALAALSLPFLLGLESVSVDGLRQAGFVTQFAALFLTYNLLLGVFNLIPAFPMDGGRILRAWLGSGGDWLGATEKTIKIGRWFAFAMILAGLFWSPFRFLLLVGVFVWFAGARELFAVRLRHGINPLARAMGFGPKTAGPRQAESRPAESRPAPANPGEARRPDLDWSSSGDASARISDDDIERLERFRGRLGRFDGS